MDFFFTILDQGCGVDDNRHDGTIWINFVILVFVYIIIFLPLTLGPSGFSPSCIQAAPAAAAVPAAPAATTPATPATPAAPAAEEAPAPPATPTETKEEAPAEEAPKMATEVRILSFQGWVG